MKNFNEKHKGHRKMLSPMKNCNAPCKGRWRKLVCEEIKHLTQRSLEEVHKQEEM
jgi:hypothetical protein